jgi:hypothetical protein
MLPASGAALGGDSSLPALPALARAGPASSLALAPPLPACDEFDVLSAAPALPLMAATLLDVPVVVELGLAIGAEPLPGAPALCWLVALRAGAEAAPPGLELSQAKLESPRHAPKIADCHAE